MNKVITLDHQQLDLLRKYLSESSTTTKEIPSGTIYKIASTNISIYNSGKVLIQGKDTENWFERINSYLSLDLSLSSENSQVETSKQSQDIDLTQYSKIYPRIGTDESGKGDFFGPLVTASFEVKSSKTEKLLLELGVSDSKKKSDSKIQELAPLIKQIGAYRVVKISPGKYNNLYSKMKNINKILGWSHARAIEDILMNSHSNLAIADQFGDEKIINTSLLNLGKNITLVQTPRGERDIAVAAASILARDAFIRSIRDLEKKYHSQFPLGAGESVIRAGKLFVTNYGMDELQVVSKMHFKTTLQIK